MTRNKSSNLVRKVLKLSKEITTGTIIAYSLLGNYSSVRAEEIPGKVNIGLSWDANEETDMSHYVLYTSKNGSPFMPIKENGLNHVLHENWISGVSYVEMPIEASATYRFKVKAVSTANLESDFSNTLEVNLSESDFFNYTLPDDNPPIVNILSYETNPTNLTANVRINVDDESYYLRPVISGESIVTSIQQLSKKSETGEPSELLYTLRLANIGDNQLFLKARDTFGNETNIDFIITGVDSINPELTVNQTPDRYMTKYITLEGLLSDLGGLGGVRFEGDIESSSINYGERYPFLTQQKLNFSTNTTWRATLSALLSEANNTFEGYKVNYQVIGIDRAGNEVRIEKTALVNNGLDSDGDGLDNFTEIGLGGKEKGYDPPNPDTDGDGLPDYAERIGGFDPLDPNSNPNLIVFKIATKTDLDSSEYVSLHFKMGSSGQAIIEASNSLISQDWREMARIYQDYVSLPITHKIEGENGEIYEMTDYEFVPTISSYIEPEFGARGVKMNEYIMGAEWNIWPKDINLHIPITQNTEYYRIGLIE